MVNVRGAGAEKSKAYAAAVHLESEEFDRAAIIEGMKGMGRRWAVLVIVGIALGALGWRVSNVVWVALLAVPFVVAGTAQLIGLASVRRAVRDSGKPIPPELAEAMIIMFQKAGALGAASAAARVAAADVPDVGPASGEA